MDRRVWTGVVAGVLAAAVLLSVGIGSYRAGQEDEVVTRTVGDGEVVRVVEDGRGFFPGFILVPLLVIGLVLLVGRSRRGRGWHGGGPGYGPGFEPGPYGPRGCGPEAAMREWHRREHEGERTAGEGPSGVADAPADGPAGGPIPASGPVAGSPPAP